MSNKNSIKFFKQFTKRLRKNVKNIGIITDKDGTLLLDDNLKKILKQYRTKKLGVKVYIIANTGRTVSDMLDCLEKENIPIDYFDYIVGDNGGVCLDVKNNTELFKYVMEKDTVKEVIEHFLQSGGTLSNIRITDGDNIYAYSSPEIEKYYENTTGVVFKEDIDNIDEIDVTKLTLTASQNQINELNKLLRERFPNYRSHIGSTSFPTKSQKNYRLDFTGMHTKGTVSKYFRDKLNLDCCFYLGNDLNDIPMFSQGLADNDFIVIANNKVPNVTNMMVSYLKEECKLKGLNWENSNLLVLKRENVNSFLRNLNRVLQVFRSNAKTKTNKNNDDAITR